MHTRDRDGPKRTMKKLLLVDDDSILMRSYRDRLSAHGFQVNTAASGSAAIAILQSAKPDMVVLDLLMPDLSGVDVLKFIRSQPRLAATPVVVLTNTYLNDLGRQAAAIGVQKALLKAQCSPSGLMACVDEILEAKHPPSELAQKPGAVTTSPNAPSAGPGPTVHHTQRTTLSAARPTHAPAAAAQSAHAEGPTPRQVQKDEAGAKATTHLRAQAPTICADLRKLFQAVAQQPRTSPEQQMRLQDLYRRVHFLATAAGLTEYARLAQTAAVFEAFLNVLMDNPARIGPSVLRTLANLVDFVELLFRHAGESLPGGPLSVQVLVVDDDPLSNRLVVSALREAQLNPHSTEDPLVAWQWANRKHFDLVLLEIEMPVLNGFELCKRLRGVPGYEHTPVIFVTVHSDFESRAKSSLSGGDDLIAKPILPMELAAKVVMHLLRRQMSV
jgi:DNA-binding response OmpR family regulator